MIWEGEEPSTTGVKCGGWGPGIQDAIFGSLVNHLQIKDSVAYEPLLE